MTHEGTLERVRSAAARVTADHGCELVEVELKRAAGAQLVRLYVDKPGGIGLDELQSVSHEVSAVLDALDPIPGRYTLEVSSPGLDRPLKTEADYRRFAGSLARVSSYEPIEGRRHWTGRILSCEDGVLTLEMETQPRRPAGAREENKSLTAKVPFAKISHCRLEIEFPKKAKAE